jgi:hypothetical protein
MIDTFDIKYRKYKRTLRNDNMKVAELVSYATKALLPVNMDLFGRKPPIFPWCKNKNCEYVRPNSAVGGTDKSGRPCSEKNSFI